MLYVFLLAVVNAGLGFAVAVHLGRRRRWMDLGTDERAGDSP
jgi:hypothetical protein